jgi:hypothetical protein
MFPRTVVVCHKVNPFHLLSRLLHPEAHGLMKSDRTLVHRRGDAAYLAAALFLYLLKEVCVQGLAQTGLTMLGVHAYEMDIGFLWATLGLKADQKTHYLAAPLGNETGLAEVDKEELGKHVAHISASPPIVHHGDDEFMVSGRKRPDQQVVHKIVLEY